MKKRLEKELTNLDFMEKSEADSPPQAGDWLGCRLRQLDSMDEYSKRDISQAIASNYFPSGLINDIHPRQTKLFRKLRLAARDEYVKVVGSEDGIKDIIEAYRCSPIPEEAPSPSS